MSSAPSFPSILDQLVQRATRLYSLPAVALEVLRLTEQPDVNVAALKRCLENDPALTAKLLRVVNSSLFGLSRRVTDLNQALGLLGVKPLKLLVLGFSLPRELFSNLTGTALTRYWRFSLTKAVAARTFAELAWQTTGDEAFLCGLLQNLGMLALLQELGDSYAMFLDRVASEGGDLATLEMASLGFDHTVLSARLLAHWELPHHLVKAVACPLHLDHLQSLEEGERMLPQILHLADLVAQLVAGGRAAVLEELVAAARAYQNLEFAQIETLLAGIQEKVEPLAQALAAPLGPAFDIDAIVAQAHRQLAAAAETVATGLMPEPDAVDALWQETQGLAEAMRRFTQVSGERGAVILQTHAGSNPALAAPSLLPGGEPTLLSRTTAAVAACRQARCAMSLVLVEIDRFDEVVLTRGWEGACQVQRVLEATARKMCEPQGKCLAVADARFALLLEDCERNQAVELARELVHGMRRWSEQRGEALGQPVTVSAGLASLAMPPRNFPPQHLIEAAQRCLGAAKSCGGDGVKSIDIW